MTDLPRTALPQTDEEIEAAFEALGLYLSIEDLCFGPASEIDAFRAARAGWATPGKVEKSECDVFHVSGAQARRGQTRRDVAVVRFGDCCAIYGADR